MLKSIKNKTDLQKGKKSIDKTLAYQVKKGKMTDSEKNAILDRITIGTKEIFKDADLIIEAVITFDSICYTYICSYGSGR